MTLQQALAAAARQGLDRLDAQLLLLHALGRPPADRAWLIAHDQDPLAPETGAAYEALCRRRAAGGIAWNCYANEVIPVVSDVLVLDKTCLLRYKQDTRYQYC